MYAKSTDEALKLVIVVNLSVCTSAPATEVVSYCIWQSSADRIEVLVVVTVDACRGSASDPGCTRVDHADAAVECRCCRHRQTAGIRAKHGESRPCSYIEVHQHVAIAIQFDHVVELREWDYGHRLRKCLAELQREAKVSVFHQVEVVVVSEMAVRSNAYRVKPSL